MRVFRRVLLVMVLTAALFVPGGLALAQPNVLTVDIGDGRLISKGVAVDVPVTVVCENGSISALFVSLRQRVSQGRIASGSGTGVSQLVPCTGEPQTFDVRVFPDTGSPAFKTGEALATVSVSVCDETTGECVFPSFQPVIRVGK